MTPTRPVFNPMTGQFDMIQAAPERTITVAKSGAMFTSIQAAINSITDATSSKVYTIFIHSGDYTENLTLIPFIELVGVSNGPTAPRVIGTITSNFTNPGEYCAINRLQQQYNVTVDGTIVSDLTGSVLINDFFCLVTATTDVGFTAIKQNATTFQSVFYSGQIYCLNVYDGTTKNYTGLEQCGTFNTACGLAQITMDITPSSGTIVARTVCGTGAAEFSGQTNNLVCINRKASSSALFIGSNVTTASTGFRLSFGDQIRFLGSGTGATAYAFSLDSGGNSAEFFYTGASVSISTNFTGYCANTDVGDTHKIWLNSTNRDLPKTGGGLSIITPYDKVESGFVEWSSVGATYWSYTPGTGAFSLDKRFVGMVKSSPVVCPTATLSGGSALTNYVVNYLYCDSSGVLRSTTTKNDALFEGNIPFGMLYSNGTNYLFKKENHPAKFSTAVSSYIHGTSGSLLANNGGGNLTTLVAANRTIKMVGASTLLDHGLTTTLPDSSGNALSFTSFYTSGSGTDIDGTGITQIPSKYQNTATTVANAANNERIVVRIGALLDNLNSSDPQYVYVYHNAVYGNSTAAQNAITAGNITAFPQALLDLEVVQLGFACITANGSGGGTLDTAVGTNGIVISKQVTGASLLSGAASNSAGNIINDVTNFGVILSSADTSAQLAFDTIDNTATKKATSSTDNALARYDGTTGQLLQNSAVVVGDLGQTTVSLSSTSDDRDIAGMASGDVRVANGAAGAHQPNIIGKTTAANQYGLRIIAATNATNSTSDMYFSVRESDNTDFDAAALSPLAFDWTRFSTSLGNISRAGTWNTGPVAGLATTYHTIYGSVLLNSKRNAADTNGIITASTALRMVTGHYHVNGTNNRKALNTATGYVGVALDTQSSANAQCFAVVSNYQDAQTAGSDLVSTNEKYNIRGYSGGSIEIGPDNNASLDGVVHTVNTGAKGATLARVSGTIKFCNNSASKATPTVSSMTSDESVPGLEFIAYAHETNTTADMRFTAREQSAGSTFTDTAKFAFAWRQGTTVIGSITRAGTWDIGPAAYGGTHTCNGAMTFKRTDTSTEGGQINFEDSDGSKIWFIDSYGTAGSNSLRFYRTGTGGGLYFNLSSVGVGTLGDQTNTNSYHTIQNIHSGPIATIYNAHAATPNGIDLVFSGAAPDDNTQWFLKCRDTGAVRCYIYADGDVWTSDAGTLTSDERLKTNIQPATSKLADVLQLQVRNFEWTPEYHPTKVGQKKIGFIAQEFAQVFPTLVNEHTFELNGEEVTRKSIRYGALVPILTKAIQEQQVIIQEQAERISTLETALATAEATLTSVLSRLDALESV